MTQQFISPQETALLRDKKHDEISKKLKNFVAHEVDLETAVSDLRLVLLTRNREIEGLLAPYYLEDESAIISDIRPFLNKKGEVNNKMEADMRLSQLALTRMWIDGELSDFTTTFAAAAVTFVLLMRKSLSSLYGISGETELVVGALVADYYGALINQDREVYQRQANLNRISGLPEKITAPIAEKGYQYDGFLHLLEIIKEHTGDPRLTKLTGTAVFTRNANLYFGFRNKETTVVAFEYPPIWCALVYHVATNKGMTRSPLFGIYRIINKDMKALFETNIGISQREIRDAFLDKI